MRRITYAHSRSIIDRKEHCVSLGKENNLMLHFDHDVDDALGRHTTIASPFSSEKWQYSGNGNIYTQNSTLVVNGQDALLISKDILEIDPAQQWYLSISILNKNAALATFDVGTVDYIDLNTPITTGRPSGATYDNWCLYNQQVPIDNRWHTFSNYVILSYHYKSDTSSDPDELHKWPVDTNYAKIFVRINNLNGGEVVLKDLDFFFINSAGDAIDNTPSYYIIDSYGGKFGGSVELAGESTNLIWNGNLKFGSKRWSQDPSGFGFATSEIDNDGSYKVYFQNVRNTKDIVRILSLHEIQPDTNYTLSFYARANKPMAFRKLVIQDPNTKAIGWQYPQILYIDQTWKKIKISEKSFPIVPSNCKQIALSNPDELEDDTLFIYYNGLLLNRGSDFYEYSDNELYLNFTPKDDDIIKVYTKTSSSQALNTDKITFHEAVDAGKMVSIKHIYNTYDESEVIASEKIYNITSDTNSLILDSQTNNTQNKLYVFKNGVLLQETDDYTTSVTYNQIQINFSTTLIPGNIVKIICFGNVNIIRENRTISSNQHLFTGLNYVPDGQHLIVFRNGIEVENNIDYTEIDNNSIDFNYDIGTGEKIYFITLYTPYKFKTDLWQLANPQDQFSYSQENYNILKMVFVNGVTQSQDANEQNDYYINIVEQSSGFKYDRYDLNPLSDNQTQVILPFTYNPGQNELWVYRNGLMQTLSEDYTETSNNSITLQIPAVLGELMTIYKLTYLSSGATDSIVYTREEYNAQSGLLEYKVSKSYNLASGELNVYLNGVLLRIGIDYTEVDNHTVRFNIPLRDSDKIVFLIASSSASSLNTGYYFEDVYYGSDVSTGNILTTTRSLNFIQGTEGTLWIKDVKLDYGDIERNSYNSGITYSSDIVYHLDEPLNKYEGSFSFYIEPYKAIISDIFAFQGEVDKFADLPPSSPGDIYRTANDYKYWQWDGSQWININLESINFTDDEWSLLKIERFLDEENRFKIIYGEADDYGIIALPPISGITMVSIVWNMFGIQWYQMEVDDISQLPLLTKNEDGYVYRVKNPFSYYIWRWNDSTSSGSWEPKAPMATYNNYSDLPILSRKEDGFVAKIIQEPDTYKGSVQNESDLIPIANAYTAAQEGFIWKVNSTNSFYEWNWDHYKSVGKFRKIDIATYYQWQWDDITQSGSWNQCNKIKVYINGGKDGILSQTFREINNSPNKIRFLNTAYAKFDEVRLDTLARDKSEILTWYKSQMPFYPIGQKAAIA